MRTRTQARRLDGKYSFSAVKAFGRYRRACGVPDGTDFHSFRRVVITVLEHASVPSQQVARFVGHKLGTMAGDTYSAGASKDLAVETGLESPRRYEVEIQSRGARNTERDRVGMDRAEFPLGKHAGKAVRLELKVRVAGSRATPAFVELMRTGSGWTVTRVRHG